jgi:integrase
MKKQDAKPLFNAVNERAKYKYRIHLRRIGQRDEKTVNDALKHIRDYELFTDFSGFEKYNSDIADSYIQDMFHRKLGVSYISNNIRIVKDFLKWLERQHGYRSKIDYNQIDYLNISRNQQNTAKAPKYPKSYSFEAIFKTIRAMPDTSDKERRDRAIISIQALCGLRIGELRTLKMESLIDESGKYFVYVSPRNMSVKFAKTRQANFMPLPNDIVANVIEWHKYLKELGFKDNDPLFPVVDNRFTETHLLRQTMRKDGIKSDTTIRDIFKRAFERAGFDYIKPHSFRKTIAKYAQHQSPAFMNAVRQNLGHKSIDTTLSSYGQLSDADARNIMSSAPKV